jgi:hypothetical protein
MKAKVRVRMQGHFSIFNHFHDLLKLVVLNAKRERGKLRKIQMPFAIVGVVIEPKANRLNLAVPGVGSGIGVAIVAGSLQ